MAPGERSATASHAARRDRERRAEHHSDGGAAAPARDGRAIRVGEADVGALHRARVAVAALALVVVAADGPLEPVGGGAERLLAHGEDLLGGQVRKGVPAFERGAAAFVGVAAGVVALTVRGAE